MKELTTQLTQGDVSVSSTPSKVEPLEKNWHHVDENSSPSISKKNGWDNEGSGDNPFASNDDVDDEEYLRMELEKAKSLHKKEKVVPVSDGWESNDLSDEEEGEEWDNW